CRCRDHCWRAHGCTAWGRTAVATLAPPCLAGTAGADAWLHADHQSVAAALLVRPLRRGWQEPGADGGYAVAVVDRTHAGVSTMSLYLLIKTLHILSSTVLFGTGLGSAY